MAADPKYTVFIRVPIPRGDFVDPPPVDWDSAKDEALWKILSGAAQTEINWTQVADDFDVHVDFLLKQVAYLTERHASQVRAQVRKATAAAKGSSGPSPTPTSETPIPGHQRTASALSRRDSPMPRSDDGGGSGATLNRSARPNASRNTSTNTSILRDAGGSSPRPTKTLPIRPAEQASRRRLSSLPISSSPAKSPDAQPEPLRSPSPGPADPSSSSSSDEDSLPAQSRIIRRPPRFQQKDQTRTYDDDDDDDESEPAFQPYRATADQSAAQDLASTLRGDGKASSSRKAARKGAIHHSQTSDSSVGSGTPAPAQRQGKAREQRPPGPLSPRRTAELSGKSPSGKSKGYSREGSDGTPSMGSSFSDLDDASVTQSALEEALASHMNRPGGSRFSISQAFRSRHTPNPNK